MSRKKNESDSKFRLRNIAVILALVIIILIAIIAKLLHIFEEFSSQMCVAFLGASIPFTLYYLVAKKSEVEYYADRISDYTEKVLSERIDNIPIRTFLGSKNQNPNFNIIWYDKFVKSDFYYFKGTSGIYAALRLKYLKSLNILAQFPGKIYFSILDPKNVELINDYINLRLKVTELIKDAEDYKKQFKLIILDILSAMYTIHSLFNSLSGLDLQYHYEKIFYRYEIFQTDMFLCFYEGIEHFPSNMQYSLNSKVYKAYKRNHEQHFVESNNPEKFYMFKSFKEKTFKKVLNNLKLNKCQEIYRQLKLDKITEGDIVKYIEIKEKEYNFKKYFKDAVK